MKHSIYGLATIAAAGILTLAVAFAPLVRSGQRSISAPHTIDGIPFPHVNSRTVITEKLAHADIYLQEPVVAKNLELTVKFAPGNLIKLEVGVRENSFWLSYPTYTLYEVNRKAQITEGFAPPALLARSLSIPLTDKLQEVDRSIDLMFFATTQHSTSQIDEGTSDATLWEVHALEARVEPHLPSLAHARDYMLSVLMRERAL